MTARLRMMINFLLHHSLLSHRNTHNILASLNTKFIRSDISLQPTTANIGNLSIEIKSEKCPKSGLVKYGVSGGGR